MASRIDFSVGGVRSAARRLDVASKRAATIESRAVSTLVRRLKPETARVIASDVLNLPASKVTRYVRVDQTSRGSEKIVIVAASRTRLPLADYTPRVNRFEGVTATTWRDAGPQRYPHAFKRRDGKKGIWQRIPKNKGSVELVQRLPIIERKGPSLHRVFQTKGRYAGHTDINGRLSAFVQQILSAEIARLIRAT